jgi:ankyrin repeat protein
VINHALFHFLSNPESDFRIISGNSPLMSAVVQKHSDVCRVLLEAKADPNLKDSQHETPRTFLHCFNCATHSSSISGTAPLIWPAVFGLVDMCRILIAAKADVNERGKKFALFFFSSFYFRDSFCFKSAA